MKPQSSRALVPVRGTQHKSPNVFTIDDAHTVDLGGGIAGRYGLCPVDTLAINPHNARVHSKRQINKIARSMEISGALAPAIVDERWMVLAGHARLEACRSLGAAVIPVIQILGASEAQKRLFLIADNRIGQDAGWDREKLAAQFPELTVLLQGEGYSIDDTGFEIAEVDSLRVDFEADGSDPADDITDKTLKAPPVLQLGDMIQMGVHRLLVGDARNEVALDRLRAGKAVSGAFLDVPYNVRVRDIGGRGRVSHEEFAFASGEMSRTDYCEFLTQALKNAARISDQGAIHFVCIDWKHIRDLLEASESVYRTFLNLVVWNKTNAGQGGLYRSQHELIGVFRVGDAESLDNVQKGKFGRNRSNVWTYQGSNTFRAGRMADLKAHPTVKPLRLVADALKDCTRPGDTVLDTFVGSGTTILAAELVGRHALAMEIEPKYADIAVRRWQEYTGRDAIDVATGATFADMARAREK